MLNDTLLISVVTYFLSLRSYGGTGELHFGSQVYRRDWRKTVWQELGKGGIINAVAEIG